MHCSRSRRHHAQVAVWDVYGIMGLFINMKMMAKLPRHCLLKLAEIFRVFGMDVSIHSFHLQINNKSSSLKTSKKIALLPRHSVYSVFQNGWMHEKCVSVQ